jgi:hypothetical protein
MIAGLEQDDLCSGSSTGFGLLPAHAVFAKPASCANVGFGTQK